MPKYKVWKLLSSTFTWFCLFLNILQNEIWSFFFGILESEEVNFTEILDCKQSLFWIVEEREAQVSERGTGLLAVYWNPVILLNISLLLYNTFLLSFLDTASLHCNNV